MGAAVKLVDCLRRSVKHWARRLLELLLMARLIALELLRLIIGDWQVVRRLQVRLPRVKSI